MDLIFIHPCNHDRATIIVPSTVIVVLGHVVVRPPGAWGGCRSRRSSPLADLEDLGHGGDVSSCVPLQEGGSLEALQLRILDSGLVAWFGSGFLCLSRVVSCIRTEHLALPPSRTLHLSLSPAPTLQGASSIKHLPSSVLHILLQHTT